MKKGIKLKYSSNYYTLRNTLAESSNKYMINILKNIVDSHHKNWYTELFNAIWADQVTIKFFLSIPLIF